MNIYIIFYFLNLILCKCPKIGIWPETDEGLIITRNCPKYYSGEYKRLCYSYTNDYGIWGPATGCDLLPIESVYISNPEVIGHLGKKIKSYSLNIKGAEADFILYSNKLPKGIIFNNSTGLIEGIPLEEFNQTSYLISIGNKASTSRILVIFYIKITYRTCKKVETWDETGGDEYQYTRCNNPYLGAMKRYCKYVENGESAEWQVEDSSFCNLKQKNPPNSKAYLFFSHLYIDFDIDIFTYKEEYILLETFQEILDINKTDIMIIEKKMEGNDLLVTIQFTLEEDYIDYYKDYLQKLLVNTTFLDELKQKDGIFNNIKISFKEIDVVYHQEKNVLLIEIVCIVVVLLICSTLIWYFITQYRIKSLVTEDTIDMCLNTSP